LREKIEMVDPSYDPDIRYTISELEERSGVSRRTIHYYISRDLLLPAEGAGPSATYGDGHLLRLRLIAVLKGARLRLEGIREILQGKEPEEMAVLLEELRLPPPRGSRESPSQALLWRLAKHTANMPLRRTRRDSDLRRLRADRSELDLMAHDALCLPFEPGQDADPGAVVRGLHAENAEAWRRLQVTPDLEIHYRTGGGGPFRRKLNELVKQVRELFAEEDEGAFAPEEEEGPTE
jgi:DNA-binding transcriptional MerR regulator